MKNFKLARCLALLSLCAGAAWTNRSALAQEQDESLHGAAQRAVEIVGPSADGARNLVIALADDERDEPASNYRLGVQVATVPELAKKQLSIDDGLAVEDVVSDSPAAKAEIKKFDILVKAGDAPLKNGSDLVQAINASDGKEITIVVIRDGKTQTIKVTPDKRPKSEGPEVVKRAITAANPDVAREMKQLEEALEKLKSKMGKDGVGLWFAKPAVLAPRVDLRLPEGKVSEIISKSIRTGEFPKDLSVQINKDGGQPAKIHVKRGDKEWDITEEKLTELPGEIRQYVEQMLGKASAWRTVRVSPDGKVEGDIQIAPRPPVPPKPPTAPTPPVPPAKVTVGARSGGSFIIHGSDASDAKLDAILKEVKQLRQEVDELRSKSSADSKK